MILDCYRKESFIIKSSGPQNVAGQIFVPEGSQFSKYPSHSIEAFK